MRRCQSGLPHLTPGGSLGSSRGHRQRVDVGATSRCISVTRLLSSSHWKPVTSAGPGGAMPLTARPGVADGPANGVPGPARSEDNECVGWSPAGPMPPFAATRKLGKPGTDSEAGNVGRRRLGAAGPGGATPLTARRARPGLGPGVEGGPANGVPGPARSEDVGSANASAGDPLGPCLHSSPVDRGKEYPGRHDPGLTMLQPASAGLHEGN